jgi:hypothetical protein
LQSSEVGFLRHWIIQATRGYVCYLQCPVNNWTILLVSIQSIPDWPFKGFFFFKIIYKDSFRTSQETHYVSATKLNRLMLFRETVAVYYENHTEF